MEQKYTQDYSTQLLIASTGDDLASMFITNDSLCTTEGCKHKKNKGNYCKNHTCIWSNCMSKKIPLMEYCHEHNIKKEWEKNQNIYNIKAQEKKIYKLKTKKNKKVHSNQNTSLRANRYTNSGDTIWCVKYNGNKENFTEKREYFYREIVLIDTVSKMLLYTSKDRRRDYNFIWLSDSTNERGTHLIDLSADDNGQGYTIPFNGRISTGYSLGNQESIEKLHNPGIYNQYIKDKKNIIYLYSLLKLDDKKKKIQNKRFVDFIRQYPDVGIYKSSFDHQDYESSFTKFSYSETINWEDESVIKKINKAERKYSKRLLRQGYNLDINEKELRVLISEEIKRENKKLTRKLMASFKKSLKEDGALTWTFRILFGALIAIIAGIIIYSIVSVIIWLAAVKVLWPLLLIIGVTALTTLIYYGLFE